MKLPKQFKLFGTTVTVEFDNKECNDIGRYGAYAYAQSKITLSRTQQLLTLCEDRIKDTFYHEKVHAILEMMRKDDLDNNENFVDTFAKLLRQSDESSEWADIETFPGYEKIL